MKNFFKKIVVWILVTEARLVLRKYKPKIVAVTGSVGKTSTKDAIYTILSSVTFVRKSEKSFNSEIGLPLTILGCPNAWSNPFAWLGNFIEGMKLIVLPNHYPRTLILEVGADRPGDIKNIVRWMKPDVAVITKLSDVPVHVEFFASPEEVKKEKGFLASAVKSGGALILNADDLDVVAFGQKTLMQNSPRTITYGYKNQATLKASGYKIIYKKRKGVSYPAGISYKINSGETISVHGTIGMQNVYTTLAALAVGFSEGLPIASMAETLEKHESPPGRMKIIEGINQSTIIDDSYNSSPIAQKAALETLHDIKTNSGGTGGGKKIAILGDMLELGSFSVAEHKAVGEKVAEVCSMLITVGVRARVMREAAIAAGMSEGRTMSFEDSRAAGEYTKSIVAPGDVVLVKGSQGTLRMERAVEAIMAHPEDKKRLLVRQEEEWQKR